MFGDVVHIASAAVQRPCSRAPRPVLRATSTSRPMRVVHLGCVRDPRRRTGAELLAAWPTLGDVAGAVAGAGAEVAVVQASHEDGVFEQAGVEYRFVAGGTPLRMARAAAALRPDVLHLNGLHFPFHARALCRLDAPLLAQDHGGAPPRRWARLHRWGLEHAAGVAFTALAQAEPFVRAGALPPRLPVFAVPESSTRFTPGEQTAARTATGVRGDPALLWIGRLNDNKDPLTVLDAVGLAAPRLRDARLWCCFTESPLLERVRARLAAEPALAARVHLLGAVPHARVELLCRAADFLLLASRREAAGFAVLEALACGATPILSDIPPFRALTGGGAVGALVPPGDAAAFAESLVALAARPSAELRARALEHFRSELAFPVLGARLRAVYASLLDGRSDR